jgi:hypothetical protein
MILFCLVLYQMKHLQEQHKQAEFWFSFLLHFSLSSLLYLIYSINIDSRFGRLVSPKSSFQHTSKCRKRISSHQILPSLPAAVGKPRDNGLLLITWWTLRRMDIMSVKQSDSLCQGCQCLHDDLRKRGFHYRAPAGRRLLWKSADSCGGCSLLAEGVTRTMEARYLHSNWEVYYHASRLSMRSMDTTLVFAGLQGSSSRRQTLSFL